LYDIAIEVFDLGDLGRIPRLQEASDGERMALGSAETKGVGELLSKGFPEFLLLGIVKRKYAVIEAF
jgi:hypothetical protein